MQCINYVLTDGMFILDRVLAAAHVSFSVGHHS